MVLNLTQKMKVSR